jgi:hypothetical protein
MSHAFMSVFNPYWRFTLMVEPQVLFSILEMEFLIQSLFMRVMLFLMPFKEFIWLVETSQPIFKKFWMREVIVSPQMQKSKSLKTLKKRCVTLSTTTRLLNLKLKKIMLVRRIMSFLMAERSSLEMRDSEQLKFFLHQKRPASNI